MKRMIIFLALMSVAVFGDPNDVPVISYRQVDANILERTEVITYDKRVLQAERAAIITARDIEIQRVSDSYQQSLDDIDEKLARFN